MPKHLFGRSSDDGSAPAEQCSVTLKLVAAQFLKTPKFTVQAWAKLKVGDKANKTPPKSLEAMWSVEEAASKAVQQLQGSVRVKCEGSAGSSEVMISGHIHLGSVTTGALGQCPVHMTTLVEAGTPQIAVADAKSWVDGRVVAKLFFTVQCDSGAFYDEPSKARRQAAWDEHSVWKKKWTNKSITATDLSTLTDAELGHFYKYYLDKRWEKGMGTAAKLVVGVGVGIAASFFDPTGIILVVTLAGATYHVVTAAGQQYRTTCKAWHILDESKRRGVQLIHDPPTRSWYVAKAAEAIEVTSNLEAIATVASVGVIAL